MTNSRVNTRIVFLGLQTYGRIGGIQRFNQRLVRALFKIVGSDNLVAHFTQDEPKDIPSDLSGVVSVFEQRKAAYIYKSLRKAFSSNILIIGHVNLLWLGMIAKVFHPKLRVIMMAHGVEVWNDPGFRKARFYEPYFMKKLDCIAAVSSYTANIMQREYGLPENIFMIFPNTVDPRIDADHYPADPPFVLAVSRMDVHDRAKHIDQLIRAMAKLPSSSSSARLVIVGDGILRSELEELVREVGLSDRVEFTGSVDQERLIELYETATLFALPSSKEGFGIVYLEAWSHRLPVICSIHGASSEVVSDGIDGFAVDPSETEQLASKIVLLLQEPELAAKFAKAGGQKILERFSTDVLNQNVALLLKGVRE
ncbi:glycosyltransferase family 4 protein [Albibacillus kandeliae]|uniref:glycosyltransferase family 4 protein n=1 Tax=Albibacillus kandeliae TaxID=2174228 RepID=UPI0018E54DD0|nr:glycosyltransferase family 4 protein [Albibacillus kandeliae]